MINIRRDSGWDVHVILLATTEGVEQEYRKWDFYIVFFDYEREVSARMRRRCGALYKKEGVLVCQLLIRIISFRYIS